ncbi:MAG TPA: hypothetical protein VII06_04785 [Chloroflexota bacterium]|jgi:hypothetical protein
MKRPTEFKMGPFHYAIKEDKPLLENMSGSKTAVGCTNNDIELVLVDPNLSSNAARDTVLHEILHAALLSSGWLIETDEWSQEQVVRNLTPWLLMFLRDNPKMVKWLQAIPPETLYKLYKWNTTEDVA